MTCRELADLLLDYLDGDLDAARRGEADAHLCDCPPCVVLIETYRVTVRVCRKLEAKPLPDGFRLRLTAALHAEYRRCQGETT